MKSLPWWFWVIGVLVIALAVGAGVVAGRVMSKDKEPESAESSETAGPESSDETTQPEVPAEIVGTQPVRVYLTRGEYLGVATRQVPVTPAVGRAAIEALLAGPTSAEQGWGLGSEVPEGTRLLGLDISGGTARVDLSGEFDAGGGTLSMTMRLAQVVYTLTQFPTVERVVFLMDGKVVDVFGGEGIMLDKPQVRSGYEYVLPAIFVESPTPGETVTSPFRLAGTANTFEAGFIVRVTGADGSTIVEGPAMASSGTGTRGTFDLPVTFPSAAAGPGTVVVYESSAQDGSEINVVEIPVTLGK